jgi:hypothetical protein
LQGAACSAQAAAVNAVLGVMRVWWVALLFANRLPLQYGLAMWRYGWGGYHGHNLWSLKVLARLFKRRWCAEGITAFQFR